MGRFSDIKNSLLNMVHRNDDGKGPAKDDAAMAEGVDDDAYGLKRRVIYAVIGTIVVAFVTFTALSSMGSDDAANKEPQTKEVEADTRQGNRDNGKLPNDYEQLQQMNARKADQNKPNQTNTARNNTPVANQNTAQNNGAQTAGTLPQIPQRNYSAPYPPTYMAAMGAVPQPASVPAPAAGQQNEKDKYSAAISFGMDETKDNQQGVHNGHPDMVQQAVASANVMQTGANNNQLVNADNGAVPVQSQRFGGASYMAPTANSIQAGTVIPAVLLTGVNTDVGGQIIAQVSSDVYDSLTGTMLLIPAGSRLVGSYNNGAKDGQSRVNVNWNYLMLPNGGSYALNGSMIAADCSGYAGLAGKVNHHAGRWIKAGFLSSTLAALGSLASGNVNTSTDTYSAGQLAAQGAMANLMNSASALFKQGMDSSSVTITVEPGCEFMAYVMQTIQFAPYQAYGL